MSTPLSEGDECTLVTPSEVMHGYALLKPFSTTTLRFDRLHQNGHRSLTSRELHAHAEGVEWLPGHLPTEHELVQAAQAIQLLRRT